jgi:hypothetical protein
MFSVNHRSGGFQAGSLGQTGQKRFPIKNLRHDGRESTAYTVIRGPQGFYAGKMVNSIPEGRTADQREQFFVYIPTWPHKNNVDCPLFVIQSIKYSVGPHTIGTIAEKFFLERMPRQRGVQEYTNRLSDFLFDMRMQFTNASGSLAGVYRTR